MRPTVFLLLVMTMVACADAGLCEPIAATSLEQAPATLSETGLYATASTSMLGTNVKPYRPRFELWADGAEKSRWIFLPPGTRIDTADMDFWQFPKGTKVWKEFRVDGKRVETRLMQKFGEGREDWVLVSYLWAENQSDATPVPDGVEGALGTTHAVPSAANCQACHSHVASHVLGFAAIQLNHEAPSGELNLAALVSGDLITVAPTTSLDLPGTETEQAALGYLHANCGNCHNQARIDNEAKLRCENPLSGTDLLLRVGKLGATKDTPTYTTTGHFAQAPFSSLAKRVARPASEEGSMPPLGRSTVDQAAVDTLNAWVKEQAK